MFENFLEGESKSSVFQSKGMVYWDVCFWVITLVLALGRWQWQWQFSLPPKFLHISKESKKDRSLTPMTTKTKPGTRHPYDPESTRTWGQATHWDPGGISICVGWRWIKTAGDSDNSEIGRTPKSPADARRKVWWPVCVSSHTRNGFCRLQFTDKAKLSCHPRCWGIPGPTDSQNCLQKGPPRTKSCTEEKLLGARQTEQIQAKGG